MKFLRFMTPDEENIKSGLYDGEKVIELKGDVLDYFKSEDKKN